MSEVTTIMLPASGVKQAPSCAIQQAAWVTRPEPWMIRLAPRMIRLTAWMILRTPSMIPVAAPSNRLAPTLIRPAVSSAGVRGAMVWADGWSTPPATASILEQGTSMQTAGSIMRLAAWMTPLDESMTQVAKVSMWVDQSMARVAVRSTALAMSSIPEGGSSTQAAGWTVQRAAWTTPLDELMTQVAKASMQVDQSTIQIAVWPMLLAMPSIPEYGSSAQAAGSIVRLAGWMTPLDELTTQVAKVSMQVDQSMARVSA